MSKPLPRLRLGLDLMPSPIEDRPGLLVRDRYRYSDVTLLVPPPLIPLLAMYDGEQDEGELHRMLFEMTGDLKVGEVARQLTEALTEAGFLEGERFLELKQQREREFAEAAVREALLCGEAYPDERGQLGALLSGHGVRAGERDGALGIAAPHASLDGGWDSYRAAYGALAASDRERTFIILGTSHFGESERFGLTRKPFVTPFGATRTDAGIVDSLERRAPRATRMEDYCHAVEHSIEFQVVCLQSLFGADVRVVPILCGPFRKSLDLGGAPEDDDGVKEFLEALGELQAREGKRLCWVLGVDMAHIGRLYGDAEGAQAHDERMREVEARDRQRITRLESGDAAAFWQLVQAEHDDLNWCGSAPFYTLLRAVPGVRAQLRHYQQWNIDPASVVTFGALEFRLDW